MKKLEVENLELSSKLSESISHSQTAEKHIHELKKLRDKVSMIKRAIYYAILKTMAINLNISKILVEFFILVSLI